MAISITIAGTQIDFPQSAQDPNWSSGVISFAEAVEDALAGVVGAYDIGQRIMNIDAYDVVSNQNVTDGVRPLNFPVAAFPSSGVRGATVSYAIYRKSTTATLTEYGTLYLVYNPDASPVWEMSREYTGNANITFDITSTGQVRFTTVTIGGASHVGRITYTAKSLEQA